MAGRRSVWSDARLIELAKSFVPAADEVWRLQRGSDAECRTFQAMANRGHYRAKDGTRQGIYVCSPAGELLGSINSLDPDAVIATLTAGLEKWKQLPESARLAGSASQVTPDHRWEAGYPEDGLVLVSVNRDLRVDRGEVKPTGERWNRDHVWFANREARAWLPDDPAPGAVHTLPEPLLQRLARFQLVDNVRGQTLPFAPQEILPGSAIRIEVRQRRGDLVRLHISGSTLAEAKGPWLMGESDWTPPREYPRTMRLKLLGRADYDLTRSVFTEFELVAVGEWHGCTINNDRCGGTESGTIGFVFTLAPDTPSERVPPAFIDIYNADWITPPSGK